MNRSFIPIFLISAALLALELSLVRLFDVVLNPSFGYMVLTCALFFMGLAGVYGALRPPPDRQGYLAGVACLFGVSIAALLPLLNVIPFELYKWVEEPGKQSVWFLCLCVLLGVPFFLFGRFLTTVFAHQPRKIRTLYFANLLGSAVGCVGIVPLVSIIGAGGIIFVCGALALVACGFLLQSAWLRMVVWLSAAALGAVPFLHMPDTFEVREYVDKHVVRSFRDQGKIERTRWDPVSKIDVMPVIEKDRVTGKPRERFKHVAFDGGSQTTRFTPFDKDFDTLRRKLIEEPAVTSDYFWQRDVLAAHYLKRDSGYRALIIGSAGGQETLAGLLFGADRIDAVELSRAVVDLVTRVYSEYVGDIFHHPKVRVIVGEGRSFLRGCGERYDIIQIYSNHTSSSMGAGTGALETVYLQTVEAYVEYFSHLSENGVLQVNHHAYPRMISTAAAAWARMGRADFRRHVAVFERDIDIEVLPTLIIKMTPWTQGELDELHTLFKQLGWQEKYTYSLSEDPVRPDRGFLPDAFFEGAFSQERMEALPYRAAACTDDKPYFNFLRKTLDVLEEDRQNGLDSSTAKFLNNQLLAQRIPSELVHLVLPGTVGGIAALLAVLVPLLFHRAGAGRHKLKLRSLVYFSCLGCGFIAIELALIQIFMRPIGFPLHTYSLVLFTLLVGAGFGSLSAKSLGIETNRRWYLPFVGLLITGGLFQWLHQDLFDLILAFPLSIRMLLCAGLLLPVGFFLGMPFPLGILSLEGKGPAAIAWAWGMNGLFTVLGGVGTILLTMAVGFNATIWIALGVYVLACITFPKYQCSSS